MKKAARGCSRIWIWSHEGPNQSQNHVSGRSQILAAGFLCFGARFSGKHFWKFAPGQNEHPLLQILMVLCQSKIPGGVFKYGLPDGLPDMAFQT